MLILLMEQYVREESDRLSTDNGLNELMSKIEQRNLDTMRTQMKKVIKSVREEDLPPTLQDSSNDRWEVVEDWNNGFWGER